MTENRVTPTAARAARAITGRRKALLVLLALIVCLCAACAIYLSDVYRASPEALDALRHPPASVTVIEERNGRIVFLPEEPAAGLIFYPGGKVAYEAYAPLMEACAAKGILCVLLHMPGNLAVLDMNAADGVAAGYPQVSDWYIGGHSLGGAMAASYAAKHAGEFRGLVLLGAYSTAGLNDSGLKVLTVYGTEDGVMNREKYADGLSLLPEDAAELVIDGGCHAYFGSYGPQKGDGTPDISAEQQIEQTADAIAAMAAPVFVG